jgi:hypothetical protein
MKADRATERAVQQVRTAYGDAIARGDLGRKHR